MNRNFCNQTYLFENSDCCTFDNDYGYFCDLEQITDTPLPQIVYVDSQKYNKSIHDNTKNKHTIIEINQYPKPISKKYLPPYHHLCYHLTLGTSIIVFAIFIFTVK